MKKIIITFALIIASMTAHAQIPKVYQVKHEMDKLPEIVNLYADLQFMQLVELYMHGDTSLKGDRQKRVIETVKKDLYEYSDQDLSKMSSSDIYESTGRMFGYIIFIEYIE